MVVGGGGAPPPQPYVANMLIGKPARDYQMRTRSSGLSHMRSLSVTPKAL